MPKWVQSNATCMQMDLIVPMINRNVDALYVMRAVVYMCALSALSLRVRVLIKRNPKNEMSI